MPDLTFQVTGVKAASKGLVPLLQFEVAIKQASADSNQAVQSVVLHAQIQIQSAQRSYNSDEKENLVELFGTPDRWGQTLRNRLWTSTATTVGSFTGEAQAILSVLCTCDLAIAATKYFSAVEEGDVPLLFLFSGSIFYTDNQGQLQVQPISWNAESTYKMPISVWKDMMDHHYPNSAWVCLRRDVFDRLAGLKRRQGDATLDATLERLLATAEEPQLETL
jgi:hypothetical protein